MKAGEPGPEVLTREQAGSVGHRQGAVTTLSLSLQVGLVALGFAWKRRDDESFFTESLQEATEGLGTGLAGLSCTHAPHAPYYSDPRSPDVVERVRTGLGPAGSLSLESLLWPQRVCLNHILNPIWLHL